jgi:hypothetical protein
VDVPVRVYVAFDHRCRRPPSWLRDWKKTGERLTSTARGSDLVLYRKDFGAGAVSLGGSAAPGVGAMYTVAVRKR